LIVLQGFPYRTAAWLQRLEQNRHIVASAATLRVRQSGNPPPPPHPPPPLLHPIPAELGTLRLSKIQPLHGARLRAGREIYLKPKSSDRALRRDYLAQWGGNTEMVAEKAEPTLLHVSLQDAAALVGCSSEAKVLTIFFIFHTNT